MNIYEWIFQNVNSSFTLIVFLAATMIAACAFLIWVSFRKGSNRVLKFMPGALWLAAGWIIFTVFPSMLVGGMILVALGFMAPLIVVMSSIGLSNPDIEYNISYTPSLICMFVSLFVLILPGSYSVSFNNASNMQEAAVRTAYAQEQHFAETGKYTDSVNDLKLYDARISDGNVTVKVTDIDDDSFFTVSSFKNDSNNKTKGFGIQGNRNGVIATCDYSNGCVDGEWDVADATPDSIDDPSKFPIHPNGNQAVGMPLQQIPVKEACKMPANPYTKNSPFSNPMESVCVK